MPWPVLRTKHQEMGEGPYTNPEKTKIGADVGVSPRAWEDKFGPHTLVTFFQQNYKISEVQRRRQMLIYLDSGTEAHGIIKRKKGGLKQSKIKTSYGPEASQRLETNFPSCTNSEAWMP